MPSLAEIASTFQPCRARKALIHPEQVAGEQGGLVAAGAGADFQHHVALVHGVLGQQRDANLLRQLQAARGQRFALGLRHAAHLGIGRLVRYQRVDAGELGIDGAVGLHGRYQRIELGQFARDLDIVLGVHLAEQLGLQRGMVRQQDIEFGFREYRHGFVSNCKKGSSCGTKPRYNDSPSASANAVSFSRIDTLPDGASSSGAIMASAFLASRSRISALTGPCAVADSDSER